MSMKKECKTDHDQKSEHEGLCLNGTKKVHGSDDYENKFLSFQQGC